MAGKIFCNFLIFCVFVLSSQPLAAIAHDAKGRKLPVLATRHKYAPPQGSVAEPARQHGAIVLKAAGSRYAKRRPAHPHPLAPRLLSRKISSRSAIVLDAKTGRPLFSRAPDLPGQPASTIKVLTGLIAMQSLKNNERVSTSRRAARMPRSKVYLRPGRTYAANDLINAVLLASANDASVALAEKIAGSERAFARLMTRKARALGARNTLCKTASGLTSRGQHSTARDLALIFNRAMQYPEFARRMAFTKVRTHDGKTLHSHNRALWAISGAEGGKTGYTRAARQTYVGKFRRGKDELVVAIMGSENMWDDIGRLVEYGFQKKRKMAAARSGSIRLGTVQRPAPKDSLAAVQVLRDNKKMPRLAL